jgi:hypothetical protein
MQAAACAVDCTCNEAVSQSLACVATGGGTLNSACFLPYMSLLQTDSAFSVFFMCLLQAESSCCGGIGGPGGLALPDASSD